MEEILCALLGMHGGVVAMENSKFVISEHCDVFCSSEREQLVKTLNLGMLYAKLSQFCKQNSIDPVGSPVDMKYESHFSVYIYSLCCGLQELLDAFIKDIVQLELLSTIERVSSPFLVTSLQKYTMIFPILWSVCQGVANGNLKGGQLIDLLCRHRSGIQTVNEIIDRIVGRLRMVFAKQCFSWMLHGHVEDPTSEYFIQRNSTSDGESASNDWSGGFSVSFHLVPESLVTPNLVSKILFAGKSVRLMSLSSDIDNVLTKYQFFCPSLRQSEEASNDFVRNYHLDHQPKSSFDLENFNFEQSMEVANNNFERTILQAHDCIATGLWDNLRGRCRFLEFLAVLRNSYLLGRGDYFQAIIDHLLAASDGSLHTAGGKSNERLLADSIKNACKQISIDEDAVDIFRIWIPSTTRTFNSFKGVDEICVVGDAMIAVDNGSIQFQPYRSIDPKQLWSNLFNWRSKSLSESNLSKSHVKGGVWIKDARTTNRGFNLTARFTLDNGGHFKAVPQAEQCSIEDQVLSTLCFGVSPSCACSVDSIPKNAVIVELSVLGTTVFQKRFLISIKHTFHSDVTEVSKAEVAFPDSVNSGDDFVLDVECCRREADRISNTASWNGFQYFVCVKLQQGAGSTERNWDIESHADIAAGMMAMSRGQCFIGVVSNARIFSFGGQDCFLQTSLSALNFRCSSILNSYPVVSPFVAVNNPATLTRMSSMTAQLRVWMDLKSHLCIPKIYSPVFDSDALNCYEKLFTLLFKVKLLVHELQRIWMTSRLSSNRLLNFLRHSMHFFLSNMLYYMQVDVIDSEFSLLQTELAKACNFQEVLKAHRIFLGTVCRLSLVDNSMIQECIEKVLHCCTRFVSLSKLLREDSEPVLIRDPTPGTCQIVPDARISPEEMDFIRSDFFTQIAFLFSAMRRTENRGFLFRLDFNGFYSSMLPTT